MSLSLPAPWRLRSRCLTLGPAPHRPRGAAVAFSCRSICDFGVDRNWLCTDCHFIAAWGFDFFLALLLRRPGLFSDAGFAIWSL